MGNRRGRTRGAIGMGSGLRKWATLKGNGGEGLERAVCGGEGRAEGGPCYAGRGGWG